MQILSPGRLAVRAARAAPAFSVADIAAAAGCSPRTVLNHLARCTPRGDGARLAADTYYTGSLAQRAAAVICTALPPPAARRAGGDRSWRIGQAAPGMGSWTPKSSYRARRGRAGAANRATAAETSERWTAALDPNTPVAMLWALRSDPARNVACFVARNRCLSAGMVSSLVAARDSNQRFDVATNDACGVEHLRRLAADPDPMVRSTAAAHRRCGPETLKRLAADHENHVRRAAAANPNQTEETLKHLAGDVDAAVRRAAVRALVQRSVDIGDAVSDPDPDVRTVAAGASNLSAAVLDRLAEGPSAKVGRAVAANPTCPPQTLTRIWDRWGAGHAVARNPRCPPELIRKLLIKTDADAAAAANPACDAAMIAETLERSPNVRVRVVFAGRDDCPPGIIERLAEDNSMRVRQAVAGRQSLPAGNAGTPHSGPPSRRPPSDRLKPRYQPRNLGCVGKRRRPRNQKDSRPQPAHPFGDARAPHRGLRPPEARRAACSAATTTTPHRNPQKHITETPGSATHKTSQPILHIDRWTRPDARRQAQRVIPLPAHSDDTPQAAVWCRDAWRLRPPLRDLPSFRAGLQRVL